MARRKKYAQQFAKGCKLCGDPSIGRGIERHVKDYHRIEYKHYRQCFETSGEVIFDELRDTGKTTRDGKKRVILHVLVKRFTVENR